MHSSVIIFVTGFVKPEYVKDKDVLEVGALDVNGTVRPIIENLKPASYVGTDMSDGKGVDVVCDAKDLPVNSADFVMSLEMLEHAEDWRSAMLGMYIALRQDGYLVLTTRSPGFPWHGYPYDYNRFTVDDMILILATLGMDIVHCAPDPDHGSPGVFAIAKKNRKPNIGVLASINVSDVGSGPPSPLPPDQRAGIGVVFLG